MPKKYWEELDDLYLQIYDEASEELKKEYERVFRDLETFVLGLLVDYEHRLFLGTDIPNNIYQFNKYYEMLDDVKDRLNQLARDEVVIIDKSLTEMYKETNKIVSNDIGISTKITDQQVQQAISTAWLQDDKRFSDRVWKNKDSMLQILKKGIADITITGISRKRVTELLMKTQKVSFNVADRLVRTELSYAQNRSCLDTFKEADIKFYRILTAQDDRVCERCKELSKKVFKVDEATFGVNIPPFHPYERCTIISVRDNKKSGD